MHLQYWQGEILCIINPDRSHVTAKGLIIEKYKDIICINDRRCNAYHDKLNSRALD